MITRRTLAVLLGATALSACAGQTAAQIGQQAATDAALIATGLENFLSMAQGVPPATAAKITVYAQDVQRLAASLSASMTASQAQPIVQQIAADVTAVAQAAAGLVPPGSQAAQILADVQLVMPLLQIVVGIVSPAAAAPGKADAARARLQALPRR
jgi:hypothetical protein